MPYDQVSGDGDTGLCNIGNSASQNGFTIDFSSLPTFGISHRVGGVTDQNAPICTTGPGSGCGGGDSPGVADCSGAGSQCDFTYTYTDHNSQTVTVNFSYDGSSGSVSVSGSTFSGGGGSPPTPQTILFNNPGTQTFGTTPTLTASASSGLPVTFSSMTIGVCTVTSGGALTFVSPGVCVIDAEQAGDGTYAAASTVSQVFNVSAGAATPQTITFNDPGSQTLGTSPTLSATATSGLPVSFSSATTGVCTVSGTALTLVTAGSCTINADQAGDGTYAAAPQVSRTFTINGSLLSQTITFTTSPPAGQLTVYTPSATSSASLPVTFSVSSPCQMAGSVVSGNPGSSCTITASSSGNGTYGPASATQTWAIAALVRSAQTVQSKANAIVTASVSPIASTQTANLIAGAVSNALGGSSIGGFRVAFTQQAGFGAAAAQGFSGGGYSANLSGDPFPNRSAFPGRGERSVDEQERLGGSAFAFRGLMQLSGDLSNGKRLNFSASLGEMTSYLEQANAAAAVSAGKMPMVPRATRNPFDAWIEGKFSTLSAQGFDGEIGSVGIGAHYLFTPKFLAGLMLQIDDVDMASSSDTTETGAVGWLAGPYVAFEVAKDVVVQGRFNWGRSEKNLLFAGVRDEFEGTRWLAGASISGTWTEGRWTMRPTATVAYMQDITESYTDTVGNVMPEIRYGAGQAAAGPQISYRWMPSESVMVTPRIGANIIWTFTENIDIAGGNAIDGEPSGPGGVRGNVDFGLSVAWISGVSIDLSGTYDGLGVSDFESKTGRAMLNVPLN